METLTPVLAIIVGLIVLLAGRHVIWLAAGMVVFFYIYPPLQNLLDLGPSGTIIAAVIALVLAGLAIRFIKGAGYLIGALVGAVAVPFLLGLLGIELTWWIGALIGAAIGWAFMASAFEWGLIMVTAWAGAAVVTQAGSELLDVSGPPQTVALIVLFLIGIAVQAGWVKSK